MHAYQSICIKIFTHLGTISEKKSMIQNKRTVILCVPTRYVYIEVN